MDIHYELNGLTFLWNVEKAKSNFVKHGGVSFEQAATVFFDPFFALWMPVVMMKRVMRFWVMTVAGDCYSLCILNMQAR